MSSFTSQLNTNAYSFAYWMKYTNTIAISLSISVKKQFFTAPFLQSVLPNQMPVTALTC